MSAKKVRTVPHGLLSVHETEADMLMEWPSEPVQGYITMPIGVVLSPRHDLQDLYARFDGVPDADANVRLSWYGQMRAKGLSHDEAVQATYERFKRWCDEVWPKRGIALPAASAE